MRLRRSHYCPRPLHQRAVAGCTIAEVAYAPGTTLPSHSHERPSLLVLVAGRFAERYGGHEIIATPSTAIFRPADARHTDRFEASGGTLLVAEIAPAMWADIARLAPLTFEPRELTGGEIGRLCARLRRIFHDDDPLVELDLQAVLLQMFAAGFRAPRADRGARPRWLDPAIGYIREHFARKITLTELGGIAGVHPVYLAQAFSRHCGTTPAEFQRTIRMQFVCDRIRAGLSLADVAAAAGFADQSHLTRVFHRQLGMTPLAWRRATSD